MVYLSPGTRPIPGRRRSEPERPATKDRMDINKVRDWSVQQHAIFAHIEGSPNNLVVVARAGTGKTTTIVEAVMRWLRANPGKTAVVCAFNKRIAEELVRKFGGMLGCNMAQAAYALERELGAKGVIVKTLHAIGFAACRKYRDNLVIEDRKKVDVTRADRLAMQACGGAAPDAILKIVSKLHTLGRETAPLASRAGDLTAIMITHDLEPAEEWERAGWTAERVEDCALRAMRLASEVKSGDTIDYSDMIFLPCVHGWHAPLGDLVVVDEGQDMTVAQLMLGQGAIRKGGKAAVIGDNKQAIYGFRGADSGALERLERELDADRLSLTTTYRCGKAIVALAKTLVPDFEAGPDNPEGVVDSIGVDKLVAEAAPGDFVLSRINAPLVPLAMACLRAGKRAKVAGKDIGKDLAETLRRLKARSVPDLMARIDSWEAKQVARQEKRLATGTGNGKAKAAKSKIERVRDDAEMLRSLAEGADSVQHVIDRAESLFTDDGLGDKGVVTFSSVHKSKGLEADRVFVLASTLRDTNEEERNIAYVAITRAKQRLTWAVGS
jgi:superfamily I DNA/RNA helicase